MRTPKILLFFIFFLFLAKGWGLAKEIDIVSDKMEVYEDEGLAVFIGKVYAQTKDLKLWSERLYVYYIKGEEKQRNIQRIIALGNVKIEKANWKAISGKATYFKGEEKLVLEENPKVWHKDNLVEGDLVIIYFNEDRSEVLSKSGGRVRVKIYEKQ